MVPMRAFVVLLAFLATSLSVQAEHGEPMVHHYVAGASFIGIYCTGNEPLVPQGGPNEYASLISWLFSGTPECAPGQALFGTEEPHGLFAVRERSFYWAPTSLSQDTPRDHRGELAVFTLTDDMSGVSVPYHAQLDSDDGMLFEAEGCGGFSFVLPWEYQSDFGELHQDTWVWTENVRVTETLAVCLATTGEMRVEYVA